MKQLCIILALAFCYTQAHVDGALVAGTLTGLTFPMVTFHCIEKAKSSKDFGETSKMLFTLVCIAFIALSPIYANIVNNFAGDPAHKNTAALADLYMGAVGAAACKSWYSTSPFNPAEDILWPALAFTIFKLPALALP